MTHKVENRESLLVGKWKYLFFSKPRELWVQDDWMEKHNKILDRSQRRYIDLNVAGSIIIDKEGIITVDGSGSFTVHRDEKNPTMVAEYLKTLPRVDPDKVKIIEP